MILGYYNKIKYYVENGGIMNYKIMLLMSFLSVFSGNLFAMEAPDDYLSIFAELDELVVLHEPTSDNENNTPSISSTEVPESVVQPITSPEAPPTPEVGLEEAPTDEHAAKKSYACDWILCDKKFSAPNHLSEHMRTHTGHRPFACTHEGCNKAFARSHVLKRHIRTHTGEKPYACSHESCDARFAQSSQLVVHRKTHAQEKLPQEKLYTCTHPECGKSFASVSALRGHESIHTGHKPYACSHVGCTYKSRKTGDLNRHAKTCKFKAEVPEVI